MFLFSSPRYLTHNSITLDVILQYHAWKTLWLIAIDETHIYAMHRHTLRDAMQILQQIMFERIFEKGGWHPLLLAMIATMTIPLIFSFSTLSNVDWT